MAWQPFGSLAAGNQPLSLFDTLTGQIARNVTVICSAAGANAITLTPDASVAPTVSTYLTGQHFSFLAAANSSAPVTITVGGIGALKAFQKDGTTQLTSGDLLIGQEYIVGYNAALDSAAGGFFLITPAVSSATGTPGSATNIAINVTSDTTATVAVTFVTMFDGTNTRTKAISSTINFANVGVVNGTQTALAAGQVIYVWAISNGSTDGAFASLSSSAPTLPAGYTYKARIGGLISAAGSAKLMVTSQLGRDAQYIVSGAGTTTRLPVAISGASGSTTVPTWTSQSISALVPATASKIKLVLSIGGVNSGSVMAAPNGTYGAAASTTNPPPLVFSDSDNTHAQSSSLMGEFLLESTNVFYASSSANGQLSVMGWTDNF